jgi:hypothetical protein
MSEPTRPSAFDLSHAEAPRPDLAGEQVGRVFRQLSDEHIQAKRRDDPEATWLAIAPRLNLEGTPGREVAGRRGGLRGLPRAWGWSATAQRATPWALAAAVLLAVGGTGWWFFGSGSAAEGGSLAALSYSISDSSGNGVGAGSAGTSQLLATEGEAKLIQFSDSSVIELRPYTTLRVSLAEGGAVVARLMQGELKANVHHHDRTDYRFQAGDYEVKVVGTAFDLAFEPEPARFDLNLREGRVVVADGTGQTRFVRAGEQLHLPTRDRDAGKDQTAREEVDLESLETGSSQHAGRPGTASPSYKELARRGQFQAIVTAARRAGIDRVLAAKGASELHELGQAARYTGQTALAEKVFSHLSSHHGRSPEGRSAAFFRGRLAEDGGRLQQAQQHYHAYLAQGGGSYAAEALGREMTLVQKTAGPANAQPLAAEYLRRFPRGAYRDLARTLALGSAAPR